MKIRMKFEKNIQYISHLDLMKAMQKILKRSRLDVKYSEGFNPHIILSIANPLPLGMRGISEFADFEIKENHFTKEEILSKLTAVSPAEIKPVDIYFDCNKSFNLTAFSVYTINIFTHESDKIMALLQTDQCIVQKKAKGKTKDVNIIELIRTIEFEPKENGLCIKLVCACGNNGNLNPMLIKKAILEHGIHIDEFSGSRTALLDIDFKGFAG